MTPRKLNKAFSLAGITMPTVRAHIERNLAAVAADLQDATTKQLAAIVALHHTAYTQGRASCAAEVVDGDAVWVGVGVEKLIPLDALRKIEVIDDVQSVETPYVHTVYPACSDLRDAATKKYVSREEFFRRRDCNVAGSYITTSQVRTTSYKMDHTERT
jgi:hypothetical protein